jgi:hypothetical protein
MDWALTVPLATTVAARRSSSRMEAWGVGRGSKISP